MSRYKHRTRAEVSACLAVLLGMPLRDVIGQTGRDQIDLVPYKQLLRELPIVIGWSVVIELQNKFREPVVSGKSVVDLFYEKPLNTELLVFAVSRLELLNPRQLYDPFNA